MIAGLGPQSPVSMAAFELADNTVSEPVPGRQDACSSTSRANRTSYVPKLDEVRSRVRDDVIQARATTLAKQRADALAAQLKTAPNFQAAAKAAGLEAVTTNADCARRRSSRTSAAAPRSRPSRFPRRSGAVSSAINTPQGAAIVKVASRQDVSTADFAMAKDKFRIEVLNERRARFYQAYMEKARAKMKIDVDPEALKRAIG